MATNYSANPQDVKNFTTSSETNLTQSIQDYSEFLPYVNRSESLQRFFGATVNQLLGSGSTQSIDSYWGRLTDRNYNPDNEVYQPEHTANRINYQFQPGVASRVSGEVQQTVSYVNWLDRIESLGADTSNHDRLFSEPGYTLDLPINIDMFVNYSNYYWLEGNIPLIDIDATITDPIDIDDIVNRSQYTTPRLTNYKTVEFVTGLRVRFGGNYISSTSGEYNLGSIYYVENVGGRHGIKLIEIQDRFGVSLFPQITPYQIEIRESWDAEDFDTTPWDGVAEFTDYDVTTTEERTDLVLNKSYLVMERWAKDKNPWARSNKWFSVHALQEAAKFNGLELEAFLNTKTRADRPIIEFQANMELYNTYTNFVETVDYVLSVTQVTDMLVGRGEFLVDSENAVQDGDIVLIGRKSPEDEELDGEFSPSFSTAFSLGAKISTYGTAFEVSGVGTSITLTPYRNDYEDGDYVIVSKGTEKGFIYGVKDGIWDTAQTKNTRGSAPLFKLYDEFGQDLEVFESNDFQGDKIFGYRISNASQFDRELGFTPAFTNQGLFNNYEFELTLNNTRYNKKVTVNDSEEIPGFYFYRNWVEDELYNGWSNIRESQRVPVIQTQVVSGADTIKFDMGTDQVHRATEYTVVLDQGKFYWYDHSYIDRTSVGYANPDFVWSYDTEYKINDLISVDAAKLKISTPNSYQINISDITLNSTDPVEITVANTSEFSTGQEVSLSNVLGTTELNGNTYTITVVDATTITLDGTDASNFSAYDGNGKIEHLGTINSIQFNTVSDVYKTLTIGSDYPFEKVVYSKSDDPTVYGEIFLSNANQKRYNVTRNGQRLVDGTDFELQGQEIVITADTSVNDVIELQYVPDADLSGVVYDVAPVHFYNNDNNPFESAGYDDFINHFISQVGAMPGFEGQATGPNNYHRTFRAHTYGGTIRQQIFKTKNIQYLLDQESINPVRALKSFSHDYSDFKKSLMSKVSQLWKTESWNTVRELVDRAIQDINIGKNETFKYAHSDMMYYQQGKTTTYTISDSTDTFVMPQVINRYGDTQNHLQVWLREYDGSSKYYTRPLVRGVDYSVDGLNLELAQAATLDGDSTPASLVVRWFDYRQLSHIPFSAVKLGFFKPTQVEIVGGELIGHDNSRYSLNNSDIFDMQSENFDVVGAALWDYELRVFNNLVDSHFVGDDLGSNMMDFYPNPNSEFGYSVDDLTVRLDDWYNRFAVRNGIQQIDSIDYDAADEFTWNFKSVGPGLASWRSLYVYTFGTDRPHTHPWEMLGHHVKPTWWDDTYSWTAGTKRDALNVALRYGITGNRNTPFYVDVRYARTSYDWNTNTLVSDDGNNTLNDPVTANLVDAPASVDAAKDFVFGDWSETENKWRKSSEYLFALAEAFLQLKPYRLHESFWQLGRWNLQRGVTQEQWIDPDTRVRTHISELHNQFIDTGIIGEIKVKEGGSGYTSLDLEFNNTGAFYNYASADAQVDSGAVVSARVTDPGRGFDNNLSVDIFAPVDAFGVELEYVLDFEFTVTHLGFNTLPAEEFRQQEPTSNTLSDTLQNLDLNYMLHTGGFTDKRILDIDVDGDYKSGRVRIPESSYNIKIDRSAPVRQAFYSGVKISKIEGRGYQIDGYNLDSEFFNFLRPSEAGKQVAVEIGNTEVIKYLKWTNDIARVPYGSILLKRQELYQFILGLGKYYESIGFDNYTQWEEQARGAMIWALDSAEADPFYANGVRDALVYQQGPRGVVQQVDVNYDGVSNLLDQNLKNIRRNELFVMRDNEKTEISVKDGTDRLYGIGINVIEYEHIIVFDNNTAFNDPIYQPEIGTGQSRIRLIGERTRNWNGRVEAPGYLVQDTGLLLNVENSVHELESEWITAESKALERLTRQTMGYNVGYSKPTYMTGLSIGDKSAYRFEKGERKYQGTESAIRAMTRNKNIFGNEFEHELYEEWLVRLGEYGDVSESRPLQFEINSDQIKTDPQHFRFNEDFVSDKSDDLIIDMHKDGVNAISGNYKTPFEVYDVLRLDNTSIQNLEDYQEFTRDAGLPLVTEVDYYLGSIDGIGEIYDPTEPYALIPNWNETTAYLQGDQVRLSGKVYQLAVDSTGLTDVQGDIIVRGTQVFPQVASTNTFIANGTVVEFRKFEPVVSYEKIVETGSVVNPTVPSGDTLVIDGVNVNFIKNETVTAYSDIEIVGDNNSPTIVNSNTYELEIYYADSDAPTPMTTVTVAFNEQVPTLTIEEIWTNALTTAGATNPSSKATARITALENLRTAYVAAESESAWETRVQNYYDETGTPNLFVNPVYWGDEIGAMPGVSWESEATALINLDLELIADLSGNSATETSGTMISGSYNNTAQFESDRDAANNLLDFDVTANNDNGNLIDYRNYVENNGDEEITASRDITVTNPIEYVTDGVSDIADKINAALLAASAPEGISASSAGGVITLTRTDNTSGNRLGVESNTEIGFTGSDADQGTTSSTTTGPVDLTLNEIVNAINGFALTGVSAQAVNGRLQLTSNNRQLVIGSGTANNDLGINSGTYLAISDTQNVLIDLSIGDVVNQINTAGINNLTASQIEGTLILNYSGDELIIGEGTANTEIGLSAQTYDRVEEQVKNTFNLDEWNVVQDPANFNIWTIDNIGSNPLGPITTTNRYDVYQTIDLQIGVEEICAGAESGDNALVKCNKEHTLSSGEYILLVNTSCVPSMDGIYQVSELQGDTGFYVDRYIQQKGFSGKVLPLRSVRFPNTNAAALAMENSDYVQGGLGLRSGTYVYVDEVLDENSNSLGYGAAYQVQRTIDGAGLFWVRNETGKTNNSKIKNGVLFSNENGKTIANFEVYDPLKGIIPGIAAAEIDIRSDVDFAYYTDSTDPELEARLENSWGQKQVGTVWWDLSNAIYLNYDQSTDDYRRSQWGTLFPTASIDVYEWTKSPVTPDEYLNAVQGGTVIDGIELTGQPYAITDQFGVEQYSWCEEIEVNRNTNQIETYFYFWVKNKTTTPNIDREYSVGQIANIIRDPNTQNINWLAATSENTLLVSNLNRSNGYKDLVMQVNYDSNPSNYHQEFLLLAENDPQLIIPEWLHISLRDSLAGFTQGTEIYPYDEWNSGVTYSPGSIVLSAGLSYYRCHTESVNNNPDDDSDNDYWTLLEFNENNPDGVYQGTDTVKVNEPQQIPDLNLHPSVRYGIETRPHQSWFMNIDQAREVAVDTINRQLKTINLIDSDIPWREEFDRSFQIGELNFDITTYWNYVDWSLSGEQYPMGVGDYFVDNVSDLADLMPASNEIAQVEYSVDVDGKNRRSVWKYTNGEWNIVFKEKATIKFNNLLWNSQVAQTGWDVIPWDTAEWDKNAGSVMVEIFDSFYNRIWIDEYQQFYAELWFNMTKYVLQEQREPDWIFKSSYFKLIAEDILEKQYNKYFTEGSDDFFDYVNTIKPFRSKMRDSIVRKTTDDLLTIAANDAFEMRIQTNPNSDVIDESETRSFRLTVGNDGVKHSSQIVNEHKVLLGIDIGPDDLIIPLLNIGSGTLPEDSGAFWINGERIEYTGTSIFSQNAFGSGFTVGFDSGFGGVTLLTGISRGTQGTFARSHRYADIIEDATGLELLDTPELIAPGAQGLAPAADTTAILDEDGNPILQENGEPISIEADPAPSELGPAWNILGRSLLSEVNGNENGLIINAESFGTIDPHGNILYARWVTLQQPAEAIEQFQKELMVMIEDYWKENYPWLTADNLINEGTQTITHAVPHDNTTVYESDYLGITADGTNYKSDGSKD